MCNLRSRLFFHWNLLIKRLVNRVFVLVDGIIFNRSNELMINPIQNGPLWSCSQVKGGGGGRKSPTFPKICHTYPTMMKLGSYTLPEEDPKNVWITWHTHWVLLTSAFFQWKSANIVSIKIIIILMMSAKLATLGLLNIKVFWNKG